MVAVGYIVKISKFISKLISIILSTLLIISNGVASIEHNIEFYSAEQYSKFDNPKSATSAGAGIYSSSYINTIAPVATNATNSDKEISKQIYDYNRQRLLSSQLTGILIGSLLNDTNGANLGYNLATSAELNNRQFHQKEMEFINNQDNINKFKQILQENNQDIKYSDEEVISILAKGGISLNDKSFNEAYNKNLSNDEINKINLAREFIKQSSFYNTNLGQTNAFNPTLEQYNDRYMYLDTFVNNKNFYEQNLKVNTSFIDKSKEFTSGVVDGGVNLVKDTITGTYHLVTSPIDTTKSIYNALINADELINQGINKSELDLILGDYKSATSRDFEFIAGLTGGGTLAKGIGKSGIKNNADNVVGKNLNISKKHEIIFSDKQLQKKLKHADDFNLPTNYTKKNLLNFKNAINNHIYSTTTTKIKGTYRGEPVTHYVDKNTGLNVIVNNSGEFLSAWKLNDKQLKNVIERGSL